MILDASIGMLGRANRPPMKKSVIYTVLEGFLTAMVNGMLIYAVYTIAKGSFNTVSMIYMLFIMVSALAIRWYVSSKSVWHCQVTGAKFVRDARIIVGENLRRVPLGYFQKHRAGDITSRLMANLQDVETIITHQYPEIVTAAVSSLLIASGLFYVDWRLAIVALSPLVLGYPLVKLTNMVMARTGKKRYEANGEMNDVFVEFLTGIRTLKAHNMELEKLDVLKGAIDKSMKISILLEASMAPIVAGFQLFLEIGLVATLLLGINYLLGGSLSAPNLVIIAMLTLHFYKPLKSISMFQAEFRNSEQAAHTISSIMNEPQQQWATEGFIPANNTLEFKNVNFSYDGKRPAIQNLSFTVDSGSVVALVGASGSGKTTSANLAMRLWDIDSGQILFGKRDIATIKPEELLSNMSVVFQDVYLFHDTILANIGIGREGSSKKEIIAAARAANADSFIKTLPNGYNTVLAEGGISLSGGEKQRIAIARCILKDAPFVILDEATASLDPENEREIQEALANLLKDRTVMVIAHRLKTISGADKIVVLDNGSKCEEGTHHELLAKNGDYSKMWKNQEESEGWQLNHSQIVSKEKP